MAKDSTYTDKHCTREIEYASTEITNSNLTILEPIGLRNSLHNFIINKPQVLTLVAVLSSDFNFHFYCNWYEGSDVKFTIKY
jgi:hypothetical protein